MKVLFCPGAQNTSRCLLDFQKQVGKIMGCVCFPESSPTKSRMLPRERKMPRAKEAQLCGLGSCGGVQGLRH